MENNYTKIEWVMWSTLSKASERSRGARIDTPFPCCLCQRSLAGWSRLSLYCILAWNWLKEIQIILKFIKLQTQNNISLVYNINNNNYIMTTKTNQHINAKLKCKMATKHNIKGIFPLNQSLIPVGKWTLIIQTIIINRGQEQTKLCTANYYVSNFNSNNF